MTKVLLVEDEAILRQAFELTLGFQGYGVETAINGEDAIKKLKSFSPDVILLDIVMPIMDGFGFLEKARLDPAIVVITFSNLSDEDKVNTMLHLGAYKHVLKASISPRDLDTMIRETLVEHGKAADAR